LRGINTLVTRADVVETPNVITRVDHDTGHIRAIEPLVLVAAHDDEDVGIVLRKLLPQDREAPPRPRSKVVLGVSRKLLERQLRWRRSQHLVPARSKGRPVRRKAVPAPHRVLE